MGTIQFTFYEKVGAADGQAAAFTFAPSQIRGFVDYRSTYSEFRLLKAQIAIPVDPANQTDPAVVSIMRVPSRAFIEPNAAIGTAGEGITNRQLLPAASVAILQQSRWAKIVSPSDTRNVVKFGFYPFTLRWTGRPIGDPSANAGYPGMSIVEYQSGKRWVPFSFLGVNGNYGQTADDVTFFGPYFMPIGQDGLPTHAPASDPNPGTVSWTRNVQVTLWCQFRGQR